MAAGTAGRIIEAARAIVTEEGAEAVSMRRVATAAGITPMAIYRHFADRDALLRAVADDLGTQLRELWVAPDPDADPETLVREQLRRFLDFWSHNLDGKLHSVQVASSALLQAPQWRNAQDLMTVH